MPRRSAEQLRKRAKELRAMAAYGSDHSLQADLLLTAKDFDQEAAAMEARGVPRPNALNPDA
jgi:hypothetical protein